MTTDVRTAVAQALALADAEGEFYGVGGEVGGDQFVQWRPQRSRIDAEMGVPTGSPLSAVLRERGYVDAQLNVAAVEREQCHRDCWMVIV